MSRALSWRALAVVGWMALTGWLSATFIMFPLLVLLPVSLITRDAHYCLRAWADMWQGLYLAQFGPLCEWLLGVRVHLSGAAAPGDRGAVLLSNHMTRLDWLWLWLAIGRSGSLGRHKVVLKRQIAKLPMFGLVMTSFQFLYLRRKLADDERHIADVLGYFAALPHAPQLLLFPEGTDRSPENMARSRAYVLAHGGAPYAHVLAPRSAGFVRCVRALGDVTPLLLDLTIAYAGPLCQNEADFASGKVPHSVFVHTQVVPMADLPRGERELAHELESRWRAKDHMLAHFEANGRFPGVTAAANQPAPLSRGQFVSLPLFAALVVYFVRLLFTSDVALAWWLTTQLLFAAGATGELDLGAVERYWFWFSRGGEDTYQLPSRAPPPTDEPPAHPAGRRRAHDNASATNGSVGSVESQHSSSSSSARRRTARAKLRRRSGDSK